MFDIGWEELLVIAIVLIVVVGPKDLPKMLRAFGKATARMRSMASDFKAQFDEALREADLDDVRSTIADARNLNPTNAIRKAFGPLQQVGDDIRAGLDDAVRTDAAGTQDLGEAQSVAAEPAASATEPVVKPKTVAKRRKPAAKKAAVKRTAQTGTSKAASAKASAEPAAPARAARGRKKPAAAAAGPEVASASPEKPAAPKPRTRRASRKPAAANGKATAAGSVDANGEAAKAKPVSATRARKPRGTGGRGRSPKAAANGHAAPNGADTTDNS